MLRLIRCLLGLFRRPRPSASPVGPDVDSGTVSPLREAVAGSAEPRRVLRWRTRLASTVVATGVALFGGLAWLVGSGQAAEPDLALSVGVQQAQHPLLAALMIVVSHFGFPPLNILLVLAAAAFFWLAGYRVESGFAALAALGVGLVGGLLKLLWLRPRPTEEAVQVLGSAGGYSFPSGHTLYYVSFFGFLFYWCYAFLKKSRLRTALLWFFGLLILLVGPSRVYLGHHWTSDVLAAYGLGFAYLLLLIRFYGAARLGAARF